MRQHRKMTAARAHELRAECLEDLGLAKDYRHKEWHETLTKRLVTLNELAYADDRSDPCLIKEPK